MRGVVGMSGMRAKSESMFEGRNDAKLNKYLIYMPCRERVWAGEVK